MAKRWASSWIRVISWKPSELRVDGNLHIMKIESSGPVIVILYHAADRNVQAQLVQHLQRNIHLAPSAVHHDQIRETW